MENHEWGLLMQAVTENPRLSDFFAVVSLSLDKAGAPYVSTLEARDYPVTATQWHPEKNAFEWARFLHIPHAPDAVEMSQEVANFFVGEARKNRHAAVSVGCVRARARARGRFAARGYEMGAALFLQHTRRT